MIGRTNSGIGGTAVVVSNAVPLRVTAPYGTKSVVAQKDGTTVRAKEDDGVWVFGGLSVGIWTIALDVNGTTKEVEYSVEIPEIGVALELTLYDNGDIASASGGWEVKTFSGYQLSEVVSTGVANIKAQNGGTGVYVAKNEIDFSGYSKLQYKVGSGGVGTLSVVLIPSSATSLDEVVASKQVTSASTNPTNLEELDVSSVNGKYQVGLGMKTAGGQILNAYMAYVHLE
jgi:hypothetical protein